MIQATTSICLLLATISQADTRADSEDSQVFALQQSKSAYEYSKRLTEILASADSRKYETLSKPSENGLCFALHWKKVCDVAVKTKGAGDRREIDREISSFISLIQERLKLTIPAGWSARLRRGVAEFPFDKAPYDKRFSWRFGELAQGPQQLNTVRLGDRLVVRADGREISVPVAPYLRSGIPSKAAVLMTDKHCYAAFAGQPTSFKLYAFNPKTPELNWTTTVWAEDLVLYQGGSGPPAIEMIENRDSIYLFGSGGNLYIEAFSASTGANQWRFNTMYAEAWLLPNAE